MSRQTSLAARATRVSVVVLVLLVEVLTAVVIGLGYGFAALAGILAVGVLIAALFMAVDRLVLVYVAVVVFVPDILGVAAGGFQVTASRALAIAIIAVVGLRVMLGWEQARRSPLDKIIAVFALLLVIGAVISMTGPDPIAARYGLVRLLAFAIEYFGMYCVVFWGVRGDGSRTRFALVLVATMAVVALYGVFESVTGHNPLNNISTGLASDAVVRQMFTRADVTRARATFEHPISLGTSLSMTIPLALAFATYARSSLGRILTLGATGFMVLALVLTLSRGAYIATLLALVTLVAASGSTSLRARLAFFAAAVGAIALVFGERVLVQISSTFTVDASINSRFVDYAPVWRVFVQDPLFGRGLGALNPLSFTYIDNYFLKTLGEMGVLGTAALVALFAIILVKLVGNVVGRAPGRERGLAAALLAAAVAFTFQTATFDSFSFSKPSTIFWMLVAVGMSMVVERRGGDGAQNVEEDGEVLASPSAGRPGSLRH